MQAYNDRDVCRMIRDLYAQNDQQYLFVIRNGELGKVFKTRRGLGVRFREAGLKLRIATFDRYGPLSDGWIGD